MRMILIIVTFVLMGAWSSYSQAPTLDPEKTVNLATGEMGFVLSLGTVKGVNGHDFPVNLYYHAGIGVDEEASPAGLGFNYEAGTIARKTVLVSDDNHLGGGYSSSEPEVEGIGMVILRIVKYVYDVCSYLNFVPVVGVFSSLLQQAIGYFTLVSYGPNNYQGEIGRAHV
jgi:hypothetical protein